jgi:hypothetical protein
MSARSRLIVPIGALAAALAIAACGSDDFDNNPRPPSPIEVTARIGDRDVTVSPNSATAVGGGLATITISNQSQDPVTLTLEGPTDLAGDEIPPGAVGSMKVNLEEGEYTVTAGEASDARETTLAVGPERASSQNELLQP